MKIIHCADLHIGSKMDSKYPPEIVKERRQELRSAFVRLVEEAEKNDIKIILISGDAFDSDHPQEKDLDYFYGVMRAHPEIHFYYLRGNHDLEGFGPAEPLTNLFVFSKSQWTTYHLDSERVTISGIEITNDNVETFYDAEGLKTNASYYNIVMLHGQVGSEINLRKLAHQNINYVALGHIHTNKLFEMDDGGIAIYPGILEPRGFDEVGEKGFIVIDTDRRTRSFRVFSQRTIHWDELDVSGYSSEFEIANSIQTLLNNKNDIYRIELTGTRNANLLINVDNLIQHCKSKCYYLDIVNKTTLPVITKASESTPSPLINEFISNMQSDGSLTAEERSEGILVGLRALARKEF